jgi:hypothetical protein
MEIWLFSASGNETNELEQLTRTYGTKKKRNDVQIQNEEIASSPRTSGDLVSINQPINQSINHEQ